MKQITLIALGALFASSMAMAQDMQKAASGASYKILSHGTGPQIKLNDIITFNFTQKTSKDSVLMSSYKTGQPVKLQVTAPKNVSDLMEVFTQLSLKDSAVIYVPTDSIFKGYEQQRPPFLPVGSSLIFNVKIERVQSLEDAMAENTHMMDSLKNMEKTTLAAYLAANQLLFTTTPSGLMYKITAPSAKPKPVKGDTLFVNYVGSTLDGKVFDTSIQAEAIKAGLDQPGRTYEPIKISVGNGEVIPGWDEGLLLFNEGAKGYMIIPSNLAYAERGGGDVIKPFSTLRFDVELVRVKKPVKVIPKKAPVKKPAGATTAKKPVAKPVVKKAPVKK